MISNIVNSTKTKMTLYAITDKVIHIVYLLSHSALIISTERRGRIVRI